MSFEFNKRIKDIGERVFLAKIAGLIDDNILGFDDDASAFLLPSGEILVLNVDMLVKKTDVLPSMSPSQIGSKAVTMSVSDVVAKGVKPLGCLVSVGFPSDMGVQEAMAILEGVKEQCTTYNVSFLGGDLNESCDVIIDVVTFGLSKKESLVARKGAKDGDLIYSTGLFGWTSLGFKIQLEDLSVSPSLAEKSNKSVNQPEAKISYLPLFSSSPIVACIDSSDGLFVSLSILSTLNNLGIKVDHVPIDSEVSTFAEKRDLNPLELAFQGGEEFELLFVVSPKHKKSVEKKAKELGLDIYYLGTFTEEQKGVVILDPLFSDYELPEKGFEHFTEND